MIDLRSDTVTKPTPAMKQAMLAAAVGDDVYGEDETVNELERRVAGYLDQDAAIFVPSGTMANQIAVRLHCQPGDEILCEETSHVVLWEGGAAAALSGVTLHTLRGHAGLLSLDQVHEAIRPADIHSPQTKLLWLENTHNRGGGRVQSYESCDQLTEWARERGLATHLDGARLWNAVVASGVMGQSWGRMFDTVSVCFSKGLGAPVGSALAGRKDLIQKARRYRKLMGGAMRQAGILAAACLYALDHNLDRLAEDHAHAQILAQAVRETPGLTLVPAEVDTNVVWFQVDPQLGSAAGVVGHFRQGGVLVAALGHQMIRLCTHLDVTRADCERAAELIRTLGRV